MSEILRLYKYKSLLSGKRVISTRQLMEQLEISRATLKRDIAKLRDQFQLPVRFDRDSGGYCLEPEARGHELPGIWLERGEIATLSALQHLLVQLQPGAVSGKFDVLGQPLATLMKRQGIDGVGLERRIRLLPARKRRVTPACLDATCLATVTRRRLRIVHWHRGEARTLEREVSPQRLVLYRDNWYLAAWCHLREAFRLFALDAVREARILAADAHEMEPARVEETLTAGYGIFPGKPRHWAVLRFQPSRARWVADEVWHPRQVTRQLADGSLELKLPYADDRELVDEILRFGPDVLVIEPQPLRAKVQKALLTAAARYVETHL